MATITIDGKEYDIDELSEGAKSQVGSIQVCDQKINQLQVDIAVIQTARGAYARSLQNQLPGSSDQDEVMIDDEAVIDYEPIVDDETIVDDKAKS